MDAPSYRPPRGCLWPSLILGGLCLLVGGLSLLGMPKRWQQSQEEWTETAGVIVESYVEEGTRDERMSDANRKLSREQRREERRKDIKATYHVGLKYRYTIAGQEYDGDAPALRQPENDENAQQAQAILPTYPAGDRLAVFHHPTELNRSRLTIRESAIVFGFDVCFALTLLICGIGLIAFGRWIARRTASALGEEPSVERDRCERLRSVAFRVFKDR